MAIPAYTLAVAVGVDAEARISQDADFTVHIGANWAALNADGSIGTIDAGPLLSATEGAGITLPKSAWHAPEPAAPTDGAIPPPPADDGGSPGCPSGPDDPTPIDIENSLLAYVYAIATFDADPTRGANGIEQGPAHVLTGAAAAVTREVQTGPTDDASLSSGDTAMATDTQPQEPPGDGGAGSGDGSSGPGDPCGCPPVDGGPGGPGTGGPGAENVILGALTGAVAHYTGPSDVSGGLNAGAAGGAAIAEGDPADPSPDVDSSLSGSLTFDDAALQAWFEEAIARLQDPTTIPPDDAPINVAVLLPGTVAKDPGTVDLSAIDADAATDGDQAFVVTNGPITEAGQLAMTVEDGRMLVIGNVDDDLAADFTVALFGTDATPVTQDDVSFVL